MPSIVFSTSLLPPPLPDPVSPVPVPGPQTRYHQSGGGASVPGVIVMRGTPGSATYGVT